MVVSDARLSQILGHVADKKGFEKCHYKKSQLNETIENYLGEIVFISMTGVKEGVLETQELIVKTAPSSQECREKGIISRAFERESYVYTMLFDDFKHLDTNINIDLIFPKCFFADTTYNEEAIVLNNMTYKGFSVCTERFLDVDHVKIAMKTLAELHALSIILQNKFEDADSIHREVLKPLGEDILPGHLKYFKDVMRNTEHMFAGSKYEQTIANMHNLFDEQLKNETMYSNITVFGHGDFWKNNVLFKYENNKPVLGCLLDFQLTRLANPAFDVLSFLLNSVSVETRRAHHQDFLQIYFNSLDNCLRDEDIYTYPDNIFQYTMEKFNEDIERITPVVFSCVQVSYSMWLGLEQNTILDSKNPCRTEKERQAKKDEFKNIIINILEDLHTFGHWICF